ncbi:hypothetical protein SLS55_010371 [Diplodia seriata]|uniref:Uncharacterized protein n=1 Tax=Diplodia seriata TaxID=420778 RepID=A0ABR3BYD4_9PEZI
MDLIFKFELRDPNMAKDNVFRTEAAPPASVKPDPDTMWKSPPMMEQSGRTFDCNLYPDLVYWLSLNDFTPDYTNLAENLVYIYGKRKLCPYFCIKYKAANGKVSNRVFMIQLTVTSLISLWNRYTLRGRALPAAKMYWNDDAAEDLNVYGIRIQSDNFDMWVLNKGGWAGATADN